MPAPYRELPCPGADTRIFTRRLRGAGRTFSLLSPNCHQHVSNGNRAPAVATVGRGSSGCRPARFSAVVQRDQFVVRGPDAQAETRWSPADFVEAR